MDKIEHKKEKVAKKIGHSYKGKAAEMFFRKLGSSYGLPVETKKGYDSHMAKVGKRQSDLLERITHFHDKRGY